MVSTKYGMYTYGMYTYGMYTYGMYTYSEVPNRRADRNKRAGLEKSGTLLAYLLSKLINEQGGIFHFTK